MAPEIDNPHSFYVLNADGEAEACPDPHTWVTWYQATAIDRQLAKTAVKKYLIITTFIGIDYGAAFRTTRRPLLWQVVVFTTSGIELWSARYRSQGHAERSHRRLAKALKAGKPLKGIEAPS